MFMCESLKFALVLATSVVLLTALGEANGTSSGMELLTWRWQSLASIPWVSACLPFELLNLAWALAGLLLCTCPIWSKWYGANRLNITTIFYVTGSALEALYFLHTKDALPYVLTRALLLPMAASLTLPASYRLRLFTHVSGLLLCIAVACLRSDAAAVSALLCTALVVAYTTGALLPDLSGRSGRLERIEKRQMVEEAEAAPILGGADAGESAEGRRDGKHTEGLSEDKKAGIGGGSTGYVEKHVILEGSSSEDAGISGRQGKDEDLGRKGMNEDPEEGEGDEEDDFEERIMELAAAPKTARDSSETIFTGRPNASAALIDTAPDAAIASLLRDRAAAKRPSGSASEGGSASSGEAPPGAERPWSRTPGSFVLTNEERMATTTSRLIALAGAASGRVPRGGVQQPDPGTERGPPTRGGGVPVAAPSASPRISITGALPPAGGTVGMGQMRSALGKTGPSPGSGSGVGRGRGSDKQPEGGSGLSKPPESRKGKEKLVEEEPAEAPRGPRGAGGGLLILPGMSEREREALAATYAAVSAARAAETMGAARPWGTGAGLPSTELDYRGPGAGNWQSPAWTGLGEEWLGWMQDMFFMGPGWDGGISRADDEREAAAKARAAEAGAKSVLPEGAGSDDEDESDDDESYDFAKMEEKYKGLLGSMRGFGGGGFGSSGSGGRVDVSKANTDVIRGDVARGGLGSGVSFAAAAAEPSDDSDEGEDEDSGSEDDDFDDLVGAYPGPLDPLRSPAPNPWAIDFGQQIRLLAAIAQQKSVEPSPDAGNPFSLDISRPGQSPPQNLSASADAITIPHFVLDASSPVLKVATAEGEGFLETKPEPAGTGNWFETTPPATPLPSPFGTGGLGLLPEYAPRFPDAQFPGTSADVLREELEERMLSSDRVEDVGAYLSTSERITQLLSAPAFTLDASVPAGLPGLSASGRDAGLGAPAFTLDASISAAAPAFTLNASIPAAAPAFTLDASIPAAAPPFTLDASIPATRPPGIVPGGVNAGFGAAGMQDVRAASERITELLAAPSFTLDASVPAVPLERAQQTGELRGTRFGEDGLQGPSSSRGGAESSGLRGEVVSRISGTGYGGGSVGVRAEGPPTASLTVSSALATELYNTPSKGPSPDRNDPSSLRDRMTLRSGRSYPSPAKAAETSFLSPDVSSFSREQNEPSSRFRRDGEKGAGASADARLTTSSRGALGFSLDASRGPEDGHGPSAFAAPTFTLDASRSAASPVSAGVSFVPPMFTLDASRPARSTDVPDAPPAFTLNASKPVAAAPGGVGATSLTLDASKPVAAAQGGVGEAAGKSSPDGYAWTQMSERLARRSNGRGISKVDQEWLKVMERVKDKLPQTQSGWKPELHIPFAALGN
ncbi:hypothetical protein KFL_002990110 [Klebsormidium nitens]|uniref:Uncharacterized protein n=1 Tax=Klebsormidium nitens TaxID=105231 RepID=A0A1Y1I7U6_KLENI|nr:hypothetical protein KFL_002990110 [Klebsormidium nitens]|eukprot:GAQ86603.1 hypothetical protein KFL_002990110 [Klebsormidium nitens]